MWGTLSSPGPDHDPSGFGGGASSHIQHMTGTTMHSRPLCGVEEVADIANHPHDPRRGLNRKAKAESVVLLGGEAGGRPPGGRDPDSHVRIELRRDWPSGAIARHQLAGHKLPIVDELGYADRRRAPVRGLQPALRARLYHRDQQPAVRWVDHHVLAPSASPSPCWIDSPTTSHFEHDLVRVCNFLGSCCGA